MNDISSATLGMLTVSGLLWSLYTYEQGEMYSAMGTMFMTLNIIVLDVQDLLLRSIGETTLQDVRRTK